MIRRSAMNTGTKVCKPLDTEVEQKNAGPNKISIAVVVALKLTCQCSAMSSTKRMTLPRCESAAFVNGGYFA